MKKKIIKNKGVQGDWILIQPERIESMLATEELIQKATVLEAGPDSGCQIDDIVIVKDWQIEKIRLGELTSYYAPKSSVLHIL